MYKFAFFVPESHVESVKQAVFATGAGALGNYDRCCWQVKGQGQFRALQGSSPYLGQQDQVERVEEYRVEMVVTDQLIVDAVAAMKQAHPYEEPAYDVWRLEAI